MSELPKRRVTLEISLGADDWDAAADALSDMATRIVREGPITDLCSGGWSVGYTVRGREDEQQTGDKYREALQAWRNARKTNDAANPKTPNEEDVAAAMIDRDDELNDRQRGDGPEDHFGD